MQGGSEFFKMIQGLLQMVQFYLNSVSLWGLGGSEASETTTQEIQLSLRQN